MEAIYGYGNTIRDSTPCKHVTDSGRGAKIYQTASRPVNDDHRIDRMVNRDLRMIDSNSGCQDLPCIPPSLIDARYIAAVHLVAEGTIVSGLIVLTGFVLYEFYRRCCCGKRRY